MGSAARRAGSGWRDDAERVDETRPRRRACTSVHSLARSTRLNRRRPRRLPRFRPLRRRTANDLGADLGPNTRTLPEARASHPPGEAVLSCERVEHRDLVGAQRVRTTARVITRTCGPSTHRGLSFATRLRLSAVFGPTPSYHRSETGYRPAALRGADDPRVFEGAAVDQKPNARRELDETCPVGAPFNHGRARACPEAAERGQEADLSASIEHPQIVAPWTATVQGSGAPTSCKIS